MLIKKIQRSFDILNHILAMFSGFLIVFCMVAIVIDVLMRYIFDRPLISVYYIAEYILVYSTFLSTTYVLAKDRHVRVDIVLAILSDRQKAYLSIFTSLSGFFYCVLLGWYSWFIAYEALLLKTRFSTAIEVYQFPIKVIIPIGCGLLCCEWIRRFFLALSYLLSTRCMK